MPGNEGPSSAEREELARLRRELRQVKMERDILAKLHDQGMQVSSKRVARLMRLAGLRGVSRRRGVVVTTRRDHRQGNAPDLVKRQFVAERPDQLWVAT